MNDVPKSICTTAGVEMDRSFRASDKVKSHGWNASHGERGDVRKTATDRRSPPPQVLSQGTADGAAPPTLHRATCPSVSLLPSTADMRR